MVTKPHPGCPHHKAMSMSTVVMSMIVLAAAAQVLRANAAVGKAIFAVLRKAWTELPMLAAGGGICTGHRHAV